VAGVDIDAVMAGAQAVMDGRQGGYFKIRLGKTGFVQCRERRLKSWPASSRLFVLWASGGSSFSGRARGRTASAYSRVYGVHGGPALPGPIHQSGERTLFETIVTIEKSNAVLRVPRDDTVEDGLSALSGGRFAL
jgi:hypothetical protein